MKAAFIHDHYFVHNTDDEKYYDGSGGVFEKNLWKRYLQCFDSLIVIGRQKDDLPNRLVDSTCENVSFELISELKNSSDRIFNRNRIKEKLILSLNKIDFAIIRLPSVLGYIAQEICIENNIKYVLEIVTCPWDAYWNYGSLAGKIIAPVEYLKLRSACRKSEYIIYVTKYFLQNRYPAKNHEINISNVFLNSQIDLDTALNHYKNSAPVFKIGLIGSFHVKWKGHIESIKALKILVDKGHTNIKIYFVGTGDYQWVIEYIKKEKLQNYIEVVGTLQAGEKGIYPFIDSLDLYIHPSKQEGLPRVVIEALSRGKLVLGSTAAGIPELLDEKFLHNSGDYRMLASQIEKLIANDQSWPNIIRQNLEKSSHYMESRLQQKRLEFLQLASK